MVFSPYTTFHLAAIPSDSEPINNNNLGPINYTDHDLF